MRSFDAVKGVFGGMGSRRTAVALVVMSAGSVGASPQPSVSSENPGFPPLAPATAPGLPELVTAEAVDASTWEDEFYHFLVVLCALVDCLAAPESAGPEFRAQSYINSFEIHGVSKGLSSQQVAQGILDINRATDFLSQPGPCPLTPGTRIKLIETLAKIRSELLVRN